jgi:hypothetical protein
MAVTNMKPLHLLLSPQSTLQIKIKILVRLLYGYLACAKGTQVDSQIAVTGADARGVYGT